MVGAVGQNASALGTALGVAAFALLQLLVDGVLQLTAAAGEVVVVVAALHAAAKLEVTLENPVYTEGRFFNIGDEFVVKIRSAAKGDVAVVEKSDADTITLSFPAPVRAAAKGQSVVIYKDDIVMGGGFIASARAFDNRK